MSPPIADAVDRAPFDVLWRGPTGSIRPILIDLIYVSDSPHLRYLVILTIMPPTYIMTPTSYAGAALRRKRAFGLDSHYKHNDAALSQHMSNVRKSKVRHIGIHCHPLL